MGDGYSIMPVNAPLSTSQPISIGFMKPIDLGISETTNILSSPGVQAAAADAIHTVEAHTEAGNVFHNPILFLTAVAVLIFW